MVEVKLTVSNADLPVLLAAFKEYRSELTKYMLASAEADTRARKASTVYMYVGRITRQLRHFQDKLAMLEEKARK